jgi:hypothetical protein
MYASKLNISTPNSFPVDTSFEFEDPHAKFLGSLKNFSYWEENFEAIPPFSSDSNIKRKMQSSHVKVQCGDCTSCQKIFVLKNLSGCKKGG